MDNNSVAVWGLELNPSWLPVQNLYLLFQGVLETALSFVFLLPHLPPPNLITLGCQVYLP